MKLSDKKALFFDYDGTLYFGENGYGERTLSALKRAREKGCLLFYNSGRSLGHSDVDKIKDFGFEAYLLGGCHIYKDGKDVFRIDMSYSAAEIAASVSEKYNLKTIFEGVYNCYYNKKNQFLNWDNNFIAYDSLLEILEDFGEKPCSKLTIIKEKSGEKFLPMNDEALCELKKTFTVIDFPDYTECMIKGCGKDFLIEKIMEIYSLKRENTYSFGDSMNDLPMIEATMHSAAIAHAPDGLKNKAEYVTKEEENGVAEAMEYFKLI
ncbi:MAG: HAD family phosphatase [Clostridia bacterium]|nr:HAD family phosphatase [Clostridia bacterium]